MLFFRKEVHLLFVRGMYAGLTVLLVILAIVSHWPVGWAWALLTGLLFALSLRVREEEKE